TTGSGSNDASGTIFNKGISTIWYKATDTSGNSDSCSFVVEVQTTVVPPDSAYTDRDTVCEGDGVIQLMYGGGIRVEGGTARWYDDALLTNSIGTGSPLTIPAPVIATEYFVRFEGNCDTSAAVSVRVEVLTGSTAPASASADRNNVCSGDGNITLSYSGGVAGDGATAQWYADAALTLNIGSGNNLTIAAPIISTSYFVRFEGICDTSTAASVQVNVFPVPAPVFIEKDDNGCTSGMLSRYVVSGLAGSSFTWNISAGDIIADFGDSIMVDWGNNSGTNIVSVFETTADGCQSETISTTVEVGGPDVDLGADQEICDGGTAVITPSGNFTMHMWINDGSTDPTYSADTTELVRIQVSDDYGCYAFDSVQVTMYLQPMVNLGSDTTLCGEASVMLDAGNPGATYLWSTGESTQQIEVFAVEQVIGVEVSYGVICTATDEITIRECSYYDFFANIPNLITPNGDGSNDFWIFFESSQFPDIEVEIYDRWGILVYKSDRGYSNPWDGKNLNGKDLPMDSYHYIIKVGEEYFRGSVTIVR
ncbi:MAG TPA: T9SS type B sorting domain-containing protein, partial [Bacteroides sp.]|nr:T9SS type B sorting domain-containing protein [Bacteroides sp.]